MKILRFFVLFNKTNPKPQEFLFTSAVVRGVRLMLMQGEPLTLLFRVSGSCVGCVTRVLVNSAIIVSCVSAVTS